MNLLSHSADKTTEDNNIEEPDSMQIERALSLLLRETSMFHINRARAEKASLNGSKVVRILNSFSGIIVVAALCALVARPGFAQSYSPLWAPSSSNNLYVYCVDQYGYFHSGCPMSLTPATYAGTNAHTHYSPAALTSTVSPSSCTTGSGGYCTVSVNTTPVGQAEYVTITCSAPCSGSFTFQYAVGVTIYYVSDHGIWTLNGQKAIHGNSTAYNHWMTTNAANQIYNATVKYQISYPGLVLANDMSLPFGGMFDLNGAWTLAAGHKSHQFGLDADIDGISGATPVATFLAACQFYNSNYYVQETNGSLHCHWPY
ncbi:MAG TPA: hypothetical protein VHY84_27570 [Bryobacteraceae bacterium]|nr:hypothetical protein [Bryobacteraceae bacterium]